MSPQNEADLLRRKLKLLEQQKELEEGLPHLYSQKFYPWARTIWESTNREIFLCSANQVGKSVLFIRKNIHLATEPSLWPIFWPGLAKGQVPTLFWYLMPTMGNIQTEFETKWVPQFLPRGKFKNHPQYGWKEVYDKGTVQKIKFNTGVIIQFRSHSMKPRDLQGATVWHCTCDEELPVHLLPEVKARLNAVPGGGIFAMCFTATLAQHHWMLTMEPPSPSDEKHPDALKIQVSLYDSQKFEDGSLTHWTDAKIEAAKRNCPTQAEIDRRIYGRFVKSHGLRYESFSLDKNLSEPHPLPKSWLVYGAVDPGSGGQSGHPAAIVFVGVSPDYKQARVFRAWRGDGIPTTASDILEKYKELRAGLNIVQQYYDWASKDFFLIASRQGESFLQAEKGREIGVGILNVLFRNRMLSIQRGDPELDKLVHELCSLPVDGDKTKAADDLVDALRYCCASIPWDFSDLENSTNMMDDLKKEKAPKVELTESQKRRNWFLGIDQPKDDNNDEITEQFDFRNDMAGGSQE